VVCQPSPIQIGQTSANDWVTTAISASKAGSLNHRQAGTILTYVCLCRMDEKAGDLRRHADHCRRLAVGSVSERTRTILRAMATEFDLQASDIDAAKPILPH